MSNAELIDSVRNWVHFDNLCANLTKQIASARNMRNTFEERVLKALGEGAKKLRIQGAYLESATRKTPITLNWTGLEESLHKYFEANKKPDQTDDILAYLREHRGTKSTTFLKKTPINEETGGTKK